MLGKEDEEWKELEARGQVQIQKICAERHGSKDPVRDGLTKSVLQRALQTSSRANTCRLKV